MIPSIDMLSIEEKVGQLLVASLSGDVLDASAECFLAENYIGNIVHFGNNVSDPRQAAALNAQLQQNIMARCGVPAFITIDHEGGRVFRFREGMTWFPPAMAVAQTGDVSLAERMGRAMGEELRMAGFQINYAPVLDVNTNEQNPVIGARAFSESPDAVAQFGIALMRGLMAAGVLPAGKHFPGHGDTASDSHFSLPTVNKPLEALLQEELYPFEKAFRAGLPAIMTSHILYPHLEPDGVPATMSRRILTDLLRGQMGFEGLIITDAMHMEAIRSHYGIERGCIEAVRAGADLVCIGTGGQGKEESQTSCAQALIAAAKSGELDMVQIDASVRRILRVKASMDWTAVSGIDHAAHEKLCDEIAAKSVTWYGDLPRAVGRVHFASAAPIPPRFGVEEGDWRTLSFAQMAEEAWQGALAADMQAADTVVVGISAVREGEQMDILRAACDAGKQTIAVLTGPPYGLDALPAGCCAACIFGTTWAQVRAFTSQLMDM